MFNILLNAIKTETIIGIIAIVIIVISLGLIIATAIRNYLLHKKSLLNAEPKTEEVKDENAENFEAQPVENDEQENIDDLVQVVEVEDNDSQVVENIDEDGSDEQVVDATVEEQNK